MAEKFSLGEYASLNKPPLFCGVNYQLWCIGMKIFVDSIDRKIWDVITNSSFIPLLETNTVFSKNKEGNLDCIAKNIIVAALDSNEFLKVSEYVSAKDMWDTLERFHNDSRNAWLDSDESYAGSSSAVSKMDVCPMA